MLDSLLHYLRFHLNRLMQAEGAGPVTALILIVLLILLAPHPRWRIVRGSVILLVLHLLAAGIGELMDGATPVGRAFDLAALFFLLSTLGRTVFVLCTRSRPAQALIVLPKIFLDIVHFVIFIAALMITLHEAGADPASLLTGSAVLTAVVGLSLRDTLGNLFAGVAIQAQRPFEVGDWIQFDQQPSHIGQVIEINWRATTVVTLDAIEIIIPNATLGQGSIVNFTKPRKFSRRSLYIHAPYDVPPQRIHAIILQALKGCWGVLTEPPPSVVTNSFDERGVQYWVRLFTVEFDKRDKVDGGARDRIWYALWRNGIAIPAPQREVHLETAPEEASARAELERMARRVETLRCVDFFEPLGDEALRRLAALSVTRLHGDGEVVIRQGEPGEELFIIQKGKVAVTHERQGTSALELAQLTSGQFFGEMSLLTGEPRRATVRTLAESELLVVDKAAFGQVLETFPELAERIAEIIAGREADLSTKLGEASSGDGQTREESGGRHLLKRIREFFNV